MESRCGVAPAHTLTQLATHIPERGGFASKQAKLTCHKLPVALGLFPVLWVTRALYVIASKLVTKGTLIECDYRQEDLGQAEEKSSDDQPKLKAGAFFVLCLSE